MNQNFTPHPELFYEKEVTSFPSLVRTLRVLDEDSGIRILGTLRRRRCMVFITRFGRKYTMMTYGIKKGTEVPARRLKTMETDSVEELEDAIRRVTPRGIKAWVY